VSTHSAVAPARPAVPARRPTGGLVVFITGTPIASKYAISQITFSNYSRFGDRGWRPGGRVELSRRTFRRPSSDCKWPAHTRTDLALIARARATRDDSFDRRRDGQPRSPSSVNNQCEAERARRREGTRDAGGTINSAVD